MTETTEPKRRGRPATGQTPLRNVRIGHELWTQAKETAAARGETVTQVIEGALRRYVARHHGEVGAG